MALKNQLSIVYPNFEVEVRESPVESATPEIVFVEEKFRIKHSLSCSICAMSEFS